ncbi:hypothetical protein BA895_03055 [Humibacillus sp. DSM 29435]|uniref:hypothetical protein n=1 Tax=Humibacillus sp. DSM 29435 TaxID=1869167 RepID=UPI00087245E4|nr:hypothetical protein [Humibacillus sp. DSM 29435]OFE16582.1 hypothetical protein BA895_03055 [Humibacillus sp. DSM 29435]
MVKENLLGRLRRINDLGLVSLLLVLAGAVIEIVALVRIFQGGSYLFLIVAGLAVVAVGLVIGRRSMAQGPRQPR